METEITREFVEALGFNLWTPTVSKTPYVIRGTMGSNNGIKDYWPGHFKGFVDMCYNSSTGELGLWLKLEAATMVDVFDDAIHPINFKGTVTTKSEFLKALHPFFK